VADVRDDEAVDGIEIRPAHAADLAAVAELRWHMHQARRQAAATTLDEYVQQFVAWASAHEFSHRCLVAVFAGTVIGMAWLAISPRVPTPDAFRRASGDVQSVFVRPEHRDNGVGGLLTEAVLALARELGLERVTVHSSGRAVPVYQRAGFAVSPRLLQMHPASDDITGP
jgi:GNAT superfamily N-acetyltransferase